MIRWHNHLLLLLIATVTLAGCGASSRTSVENSVADADSSALTAEAEQPVVVDITPTATKEPTPVPTPTPTELPTPTPTAIPCHVEADDFLKELDGVVREWNDASTLARSTTQQLALTAQIDRLQSIRRKTADLSPPPCAKTVRDRYVGYMQVEIDGLLRFLRQGDSSEAANLLGLAEWLGIDAKRVVTDFAQGAAVPDGSVSLHSVEYVVQSSTLTFVPVGFKDLGVNYKCVLSSSILSCRGGSTAAGFDDFEGRLPRLSWSLPATYEFLAPPGFPLSIVAVSEQQGDLTCEIWVDGTLVDRNESSLAEDQVVCSGVVPKE